MASLPILIGVSYYIHPCPQLPREWLLRMESKLLANSEIPGWHEAPRKARNTNGFRKEIKEQIKAYGLIEEGGPPEWKLEGEICFAYYLFSYS